MLRTGAVLISRRLIANNYATPLSHLMVHSHPCRACMFPPSEPTLPSVNEEDTHYQPWSRRRVVGWRRKAGTWQRLTVTNGGGSPSDPRSRRDKEGLVRDTDEGGESAPRDNECGPTRQANSCAHIFDRGSPCGNRIHSG